MNPPPPIMEKGSPPIAKQRWIVFDLLIAHAGAHLILILFIIIGLGLLAFASIALCLAQISLLGFWAGLGPWALSARVCCSLGAALLLCSAVVIAFASLANINELSYLIFGVGTVLFNLYLLSALVGFLIRRINGKWLARQEDDPEAIPTFQFSIKQIMLLITGIALLLAVARFTLPDDVSFPIDISFSQFALFEAIALFLSFIAALITLPALYIPMENWKQGPSSLGALAIYALVISLFEGMIALGITKEIIPLGLCLAINFYVVFTLCPTQKAMRRCGFQLRPMNSCPVERCEPAVDPSSLEE